MSPVSLSPPAAFLSHQAASNRATLHRSRGATPPVWTPVRAQRFRMSAAWWHWLASTDSLTARLVAASPAPFSVRLLRQGIARAYRDEAQALGMPIDQVAWIREVALMSGERAWISARSVAPLTRIGHRRLRSLGERSLGSWLFAQPDLERGPIELTRLGPAAAGDWIRRSRFRHGAIELLVQECFRFEMAEDLGLDRQRDITGRQALEAEAQLR